MSHIHTSHLLIAAYALVQLVFIFSKWNWIKTALTEGGNASALRLCGWQVVNGLLFCEILHTIKKGGLDDNHLKCWLIFSGALFGIIKAAQILAFKGVKEPVPDAPPKP